MRIESSRHCNAASPPTSPALSKHQARCLPNGQGDRGVAWRGVALLTGPAKQLLQDPGFPPTKTKTGRRRSRNRFWPAGGVKSSQDQDQTRRCPRRKVDSAGPEIIAAGGGPAVDKERPADCPPQDSHVSPITPVHPFIQSVWTTRESSPGEK